MSYLRKVEDRKRKKFPRIPVPKAGQVFEDKRKKSKYKERYDEVDDELDFDGVDGFTRRGSDYD